MRIIQCDICGEYVDHAAKIKVKLIHSICRPRKPYGQYLPGEYCQECTEKIERLIDDLKLSHGECANGNPVK